MITTQAIGMRGSFDWFVGGAGNKSFSGALDGEKNGQLKEMIF